MTFIINLTHKVHCVLIMDMYKWSGVIAPLILRSVATRRREEVFTEV